jgi:hypothetical protein
VLSTARDDRWEDDMVVFGRTVYACLVVRRNTETWLQQERVKGWPEARNGYLDSIQGTFWRWDSTALVGGFALGILMTLVNAVMERIDMLLTGGSFVILGAVGFYTVASTATLLFRLPGGIVAGEVNAFVALLTGSSVIAPWFIPTNAAYALIYGLVVWKIRMNTWEQHFAANFLGVWLSMLLILFGQLTVLDLPVKLALSSYVVTCVAGTVGATVLSIVIVRAVNRLDILS